MNTTGLHFPNLSSESFAGSREGMLACRICHDLSPPADSQVKVESSLTELLRSAESGCQCCAALLHAVENCTEREESTNLCTVSFWLSNTSSSGSCLQVRVARVGASSLELELFDDNGKQLLLRVPTSKTE
jgi:hypothetical protein